MRAQVVTCFPVEESAETRSSSGCQINFFADVRQRINVIKPQISLSHWEYFLPLLMRRPLCPLEQAQRQIRQPNLNLEK